jgi:hypothetical protein
MELLRWGARRPKRFPSVRHDIVGSHYVMLAKELVIPQSGTRLGNSRPAARTDETGITGKGKKTGKLLRRKNSRHVALAVDNPHRRCSAWLGVNMSNSPNISG